MKTLVILFGFSPSKKKKKILDYFFTSLTNYITQWDKDDLEFFFYAW